MNTMISPTFYWNVCSALLGTNVSYGNEDAFYPYFEQGGPVLAYKQLLGLDSTQTYFAELGLEVGSMDDRIPLDRAELAKRGRGRSRDPQYPEHGG